ncbi:hypothetical protein NDU88_005276 [Pleurodeles waltl]|uniref:Caspase-6 n=1 Tax=Pleurodeles waltl TaxID=8319 RepID=A0AAV7WUA7_PLEWA|nr:hypothetical protein NDU88_005276 [Pleurodeles waltl]
MAEHAQNRLSEGSVQTDSQRIPVLEGGCFTGTGQVDARCDRFNPAEEYKMNNKRRGVALIFNHEWFDWGLQLPERRGTNADRDNLLERLSELGFEVSCYFNLKTEDIDKTILDASTADHSDADCFLCVFLSHGEKDHVFSYDGKIEIQGLTKMFKGDKCPSLVGKPKIFIVQACRGKQCDNVIACDSVDSMMEPKNEIQVDAASVYTLPAGADFLMCYSVAEGYFAVRNARKGSWFIQDLCDTLQKYGSSLEMLEILTLVNRKVSVRRVHAPDDIEINGKKQMPCFASMLTKKLYLRPK